MPGNRTWTLDGVKVLFLEGGAQSTHYWRNVELLHNASWSTSRQTATEHIAGNINVGAPIHDHCV